jgi:hypothetical protein
MNKVAKWAKGKLNDFAAQMGKDSSGKADAYERDCK